MRRSYLVLAAALPLLLLIACSSSSKKNNNAANNAVDNSILGQATFVSTAVKFTAIPASTSAATPYPVPTGAPTAGVPDPCVALSSGPQPPNATLPPPTPIAAFTPGTQPVRPAVDFSKLDLSSGTVPSGFTALNDGKLDTITLANSAAYPAYSYAYLQTIGFLGSRGRSWTQDAVNGRLPLLGLFYFAFNNDAGASTFLHDPVIARNECFKQEQGASIGQETRHDSFQYPGDLSTGGQGIFEGHNVFWRCGRVLMSVQLVGGPGQYSAAAVDAIAQKVQADFVKAGQPCA